MTHQQTASERDDERRLSAYEVAASRLGTDVHKADHDDSPTGRETGLDLFRAVPSALPALFYFDARLTYGELDQLSDRLAGWWALQGVGAGDRVAIILQNTPQFVVAALGAWKVGAIVVALNPMYRTPELTKMFADCEPKAILCHGDQWAIVEPAAASFVMPELMLWTGAREFQSRNDARILPDGSDGPAERALSLVLSREPSPVPTVRLNAKDIGLLLYTSGTTGQPKGAMLTHRNLVANALVSRAHFELNSDSRIFGLAPLFHVTGFEIQVVGAFAAGASQVLTYRFHPSVALDAFVEHRPTFIVGAITAFIALMNHNEVTRDHFSSFQHIYSGGAPIPPAVINAFAQRFERSIRTSYGMTETTAPSHLSPREGMIPVDANSGALSIGVRVPGVDVIVVNDRHQPLEPYEHGELVVRGPGVMSGYWRKPAETAEALKGGWMHTGDVGFFDEAGWFYLVDRKKDMISASGFKVWPREVEDVLYAFPGIREAAVIGAPDAYRGETVLAFVSAQPDTEIDVTALSGYCRKQLAAYKCPTEIRVVPDLPKTITGKIRRNALRDDLLSR